MTELVSTEITRVLKEWSAGGQTDQLAPKVREELRRRARRYMRSERTGNTLQTTALVNEVYLWLVDVKNVGWQDRVHFFAVAAQRMRRIMVDAARVRESAKHGDRAAFAEHSTAVDLNQVADVSSGRDRKLVAINEALGVLAQIDHRRARVVELRFKPTPLRFATSAFAGFVKIRLTWSDSRS